ncbi:MAG: TIM barrel protein [Balneolaceae bacterium]|nr:TIM barrel protein [Balneolaceae bacterium]
MDHSRRSFLKKSGLLAGGAALTSLSFLQSCASSDEVEEVTNTFGIQLYTLRDIIGDDPRGVISSLAEFGYKQIESYEGSMGIFWGMSHTEFKQFLDDLGLSMISTHANVSENYQQKVDQLAEIGVPYIINPYVGPQESIDDFYQLAEQFNELGQIANDAGITFAYHNHAYSFEELDGEIPQVVMMENTDPDLVEFQMDMYWVVEAGEDILDWIRRYPNRFTSGHVKDSSGGEDAESVVLGTGTIDYPSIVQVAQENGMEHFIVEQEAYTGTTPMDAAQADAEYMKNLQL